MTMIYESRAEMRERGWRFTGERGRCTRCEQPTDIAIAPTGIKVAIESGASWLHRESCVRPRCPREDTFRSQRYKCPTHGTWLRLRELDGPKGPIRFWACNAEVNCSFKRPCKYQQGSPRANAAQRRAAKATASLPFDNVTYINEARITCQ